MRDIIIFIDTKVESLEQALDKDTFLKGDCNLGAITAVTLEPLYNEVAPIIITSSLWRNILEHAEFIENLFQYSLDSSFMQSRYFNNPKYRSSYLADRPMMEKFSFAVRTLYALIKEMNTDVRQLSAVCENISDIVSGIYSNAAKYYELAKKMTDTNENQYIWKFVTEAFKCYLTVYKIKNSSWDMRQIGPGLYLFIPAHYINKIKQTIETIMQQNKLAKFSYSGLTGFTLDEIILGLKYVRLPQLSQPFVANAHQRVDIEPTLIADLQSVFITKADFIKEQIQVTQSTTGALQPSRYLWNICGFGHGSIGIPSESFFYVMGLSNTTFSQLLTFFNTMITTHFFFYTSCYAAGHRLQAISALPLQYILCVGAITNAPTESIDSALSVPLKWYQRLVFKADSIDIKTYMLKPCFVYDFNAFFESQRSSNTPYIESLNYIQAFWQKQQSSSESIIKEFFEANIPQVKFPGSDWFNVIDLQRYGISLTKAIAAIYEAREIPLIIDNKNVLFLYAIDRKNTGVNNDQGTINAPFIIRKRMPTIVSMAPNDANHYFSIVDAGEFNFSEVLRAFLGVEGTAYARTYYINKLIIKNSVFAYSQRAQLGPNENEAAQLLSELGITPNVPVVELENVLFVSNTINYKLLTSLDWLLRRLRKYPLLGRLIDMTRWFEWGVYFSYAGKHYSILDYSYTSSICSHANLLGNFSNSLQQRSSAIKALVFNSSIPTGSIEQFNIQDNSSIINTYHSLKNDPVRLLEWLSKASDKEQKAVLDFVQVEKAQNKLQAMLLEHLAQLNTQLISLCAQV